MVFIKCRVKQRQWKAQTRTVWEELSSAHCGNSSSSSYFSGYQSNVSINKKIVEKTIVCYEECKTSDENWFCRKKRKFRDPLVNIFQNRISFWFFNVVFISMEYHEVRRCLCFWIFLEIHGLKVELFGDGFNTDGFVSRRAADKRRFVFGFNMFFRNRWVVDWWSDDGLFIFVSSSYR